MAEYVFVDLPLMPRAYGSVPLRPTIRNTLNKGNGYLAGEFPGGTTTVEGAPVSATVRVLLRTESGHAADGEVVAEVQSAPDGTWIVPDVPVNRLYDVVGRKEGFNDIVVAGVTPTSMVDITYTGDITINETFTGALGYLDLVGGIPPYAASVVDPLPAGIFPVVNGRQLIIDGTTTDDDVFNSTVRITSSNGAMKDVPVKLVVGFKAPANLEAETVEDAGAYSVVLTWEVTNSTQEVLVFKSATPFDLESMPAPIATLTGDAVSYTDDDVIEYDEFYYMAASVCEGSTLYSDEVREVVVPGDQHWDKVVALLHFDGDFADETGGLVTTSGSLSFEQGKFDDAVRFTRSASPRSFIRISELPIGTGDFTVECYIKLENLSLNNTIFDFRLGLGLSQLPLVESDGGNLYVWVNGAYIIGPAALVMSSSEYKHLALVRESGVLYLWLDGSLIGYAGYTHDMGAAELTVGMSTNTGSSNTSFDLSGQLDELRITKGVARYTENFTPPNEPFPNK